MITQEIIKTLDCGIRKATFSNVQDNYPELLSAFDDFPNSVQEFYFDIKVHMLMPNQYPCIPNWHCDHVPRINMVPQKDLIKPNYPIYLWLSNGPFTEFKDGREVCAQKWVEFNQEDVHRGTKSQEHIWRVFIRATHKEIMPEYSVSGKTRHSQVYLDEKEFIW